MSAVEWAGLAGAAVTFAGLIGGGFGFLINLVVAQSKDTIQQLQQDRDYWRERAERCEANRRESPFLKM